MSKSQDLIRPFWSPNNVVKLSMTCLTGIGYDVLGEIETTSSKLGHFQAISALLPALTYVDQLAGTDYRAKTPLPSKF
ncbi:unnamed protein product [Fusarium graminearum]|nr:unnamed protein product [Fusarium graminearum]VTO84345.1 unnamed protein product [Fusarium graminearum]